MKSASVIYNFININIYILIDYLLNDLINGN